jgi:DNA-directed RNA polymerase subunit M/transcription elongation factor TFIIS
VIIEFCPQCGSAILLVKRDGKVAFACSKCGYRSDTSRKVVKTFKSERVVFVISKEGQTKPKPKEGY